MNLVWGFLCGMVFGSYAWFFFCLFVYFLVFYIYVVVVNVEDVDFGRRFDFFYSGTVFVMVLRVEFKG